MTHTNDVLQSSKKSTTLEDSILGEATVEDSAYDELEWATEKVEYDDLIQVTDEYVVHARGFTVEDEILLDQYAVNFGHQRWWDSELQEKYGRDWSDTDPNEVLYWSVTGAGSVLVQYPGEKEITKEGVGRMVQTFDVMNVPEGATVVWSGEYGGSPVWHGQFGDLLESGSDE